MTQNIVEKVLGEHLISGTLAPGEPISYRMDQVLLQDATGTMAWMEFEQLGKDRVDVPLVVQYVDHNMIQLDFKNPDDHFFLQTCAARYGAVFSRPGNGISHYVHLERFDVPWATLVGSDSHTTTAGAVGMFALGIGGMDAAVAMAGHPFELTYPSVVRVVLENKLSPWVSAKDVILEMLRRLTVKGGINKAYAFDGDGVETLSVTERATICNMILELGSTAGIFPADERTREFLEEQQRADDFRELLPDPGATYQEEMVIDLASLEPLIAKPRNPDNVVPVREVAGTKVAQVCVGSSVNSSYEDLAIPAFIVKEGGGVNPWLDMTVSPGSRQVLNAIASTRVLADYIAAGARLLEPACGPCVGMGQAPPSGQPSVRTMNRNFQGRSGTEDDFVYLASPATAGATALKGEITDPRDLGMEPPAIDAPKPVTDDSLLISPPPAENATKVQIMRGPNIKPPPIPPDLPDSLAGRVLIVLPDNISTGSMSPDGVIVMAERSNIPAIAEYCFRKEDPGFVSRAKEWGGGFIVAGDNYGQGSSREHAALAPLQLGVRAVFAKGFHRIHRRNLINNGIIPMLIDADVYDQALLGQEWHLPKVRSEIGAGSDAVTVQVEDRTFTVRNDLNDHEREQLLAGGLLRYLRGKAASGT
ncbi:MAG TPA: aconitate hydratase [Actinomycetota bacterium]|nr:aconitate hydratase [Actinomycetota bacterium]